MDEQNKTSIFRKQSIDSVSSPEQLNDYIRAASPGVWFIMISIICLLIGACVWGIFGRLDTRITTGAICTDGTLTIFIPEKYEEIMTDGMKVTVNDKEYTIDNVEDKLVQLTESFDPYALHKAGLAVGDFGIKATAETDLPDGSYKVMVTVDSSSPMSFVIN